MNPEWTPAAFREILTNGGFADLFRRNSSKHITISTQAHFNELIDYMISSKTEILLPYMNNLNNFEAFCCGNKISTEKFTEIVNIWKTGNKDRPPLWYVPFLISKYEFNEKQINIINQNPLLSKLYTIFTKDKLSDEDVLYLIEWYDQSRIIQMDNICGIYSEKTIVKLLEKISETIDTFDVKEITMQIVNLCSKIQLEKYDTILNCYLDSHNPLLSIMVLLVNIFNLDITTEDLRLMRTRRYFAAIIWSIVRKKAKYDYVIYKDIYHEINTPRNYCDVIKKCTGDDIIIDCNNFLKDNHYFVNDNISEILYLIYIGEQDKATEFINKNNIQITYEYIYEEYIRKILPYTGHNMSILLFFLQYKIIFDKKMFIKYADCIRELSYDIFLVFNNNGMVFDLEIFRTLCKCKIIINNLDSRELDLQKILNICDKYDFHPIEYSYIFYNNKDLYYKYICSTKTNLQYIKKNIEIYTDELIMRLYKYNTKIYNKLHLLNKIKPPLAILLYKYNFKKNDRQIMLDAIKNNGSYLPAEFASEYPNTVKQ
jgi:hypothetical protein